MQTTTALSPTSQRGARPPLTRAERRAFGTLIIATAAFAAYGLKVGAPSTISYLATVAGLAAGVVALRRRPLPGPLAGGLVAIAIGHFAGGLIRVGDDVLYNTHVGSRVFQYDHLEHSAAVFVAILVLWELFGPSRSGPADHRSVVLLCVLAGLGLGALNEMIEFLTTLAHNGAHVGGYENTGWDLVCNSLGATLAGIRLANGPGRDG